MRTVAASVSVVTTNGKAGKAGATVSSFSSVSADPPTLLVCLNAESRIAKTIEKNMVYCINVLPENAQIIADRFAGRHDDTIVDRFIDVEYSNKSKHGPEIKDATTFACDVQQILHSGSHLIIIGDVKEIKNANKKPLTYQDGEYQRIVPQE